MGFGQSVFILYEGLSERNVSYLLPCKLQYIQRAQKHCLIEQILSYRTPFFDIVTTIGYAL
jgi:hypothetical protein